LALVAVASTTLALASMGASASTTLASSIGASASDSLGSASVEAAVAADTNRRTSVKEEEYLLLFLLRWRFVFALGNNDLYSESIIMF
jgi:hypothetical protein